MRITQEMMSTAMAVTTMGRNSVASALPTSPPASAERSAGRPANSMNRLPPIQTTRGQGVGPADDEQDDAQHVDHQSRSSSISVSVSTSMRLISILCIRPAWSMK